MTYREAERAYDCPSCALPMNPHTHEQLGFVQCGKCGGSWVEWSAPSLFDVCKDALATSVAGEKSGGRSALQCPRCAIELDGNTCERCHGTWISLATAKAIVSEKSEPSERRPDGKKEVESRPATAEFNWVAFFDSIVLMWRP